jgi:glycosyltransferase involved in cell wall biosynthesis
MLRAILLAQVDAIGVLSTEERAGVLALGLDAEDVFVVKNAIEPPAPGPAGGTDVPGVPRLLFIARMVPTKGLIDVIRACALLAADGHDFSLLCVGDGPARREGEEEVRLRGLADRVQFVGYVPESETGRFYASSTALVFPTQTEGFSITIFNAVAAGLPVVTTRIRGAADHLSEPENCLWVEPRDPVGLAQRIGELLDDPELRASMRENNLALAPRFRAAYVVGEYIDLYRTLDERARMHR